MKIIQVGLMLITLVGCAIQSDEFPIPYGDSYTLKFKLDWDTYSSGRYEYGPNPRSHRSIGGSEVGLREIHDLKLILQRKDGRQINLTIDTAAALQAVLERTSLPSFADNEATVLHSAIVVDIGAQQVDLGYRIYVDHRPDDELLHFVNQDFEMQSYPLPN